MSKVSNNPDQVVNKTPINWRSIEKVGLPNKYEDRNKKYLVTDGEDIATSTIKWSYFFKENSRPELKFISWEGDDNMEQDSSSCCGNNIEFNIQPTHYCPIEELSLPLESGKEIENIEIEMDDIDPNE